MYYGNALYAMSVKGTSGSVIALNQSEPPEELPEWLKEDLEIRAAMAQAMIEMSDREEE